MGLIIVYSILFVFLIVSYYTVDFAIAGVFPTAVACSAVFLVSAYLFLKNRRRNYFLSFELFFFFVFFLVTYSFPLMAFNEEDLLLLVDISPYLVNKSVYLSTLGYMAYLLGATLFSKAHDPNRDELKFDFEKYDLPRVAFMFNRITSVFVVLFFLVDGATLMVRYSNETTEVTGGYVLPYVRVLMIISTVLELSRLASLQIHSFKDALKSVSLYYLFNIGLLLPFFLIIGYRSEFLVLALTVFVVYALMIKPVHKGLVVVLVVAGFWIMALLKFFRGFNDVDVNELQGDGAFTMIGIFSEFYIPSSTLYEFVSYVDANGPTFGTNTLLHILSFIPFLQSVVVRISGIDVTAPAYQTSSDFISNYILGEDRSWGLGTHVIGDLYYSFGFPGVILLMFAMGVVVSYLTERIIYRKQFNLLPVLFFIVLTSQSFFFSRVEYFRPVRDLGLIFFILLIARFTMRMHKAPAGNADEQKEEG